MISITRRLEFDAAHRLINHEGKCKHLHGHRYVVVVEVEAPELDAVGRVIDFSAIKELVGGWIDEFLDHGTIINTLDQRLGHWLAENGQKYYTTPENPTAENIAMEIHRVASGLLAPRGLRLVKTEVFETPNCSAVYRPPGR